MARPRVTIEERWMKYIEVLADEDCWLWKGHPPDQYGVLRRGGGQSEKIGAHVFAYEWHYGPAPEELIVCHHCDTPACCNPLHLFLGTHGDNIRDAAAKGRNYRGDQHWSKTPGRSSAAQKKRAIANLDSWNRGEARYNAKLTEEKVRELRRRHAAGEKPWALAKEFGVNDKTVRDALKGITWR